MALPMVVSPLLDPEVAYELLRRLAKCRLHPLLLEPLGKHLEFVSLWPVGRFESLDEFMAEQEQKPILKIRDRESGLSGLDWGADGLHAADSSLLLFYTYIAGLNEKMSAAVSSKTQMYFFIV